MLLGVTRKKNFYPVPLLKAHIFKDPGKRGHIVADTLLPMHDVSWASQTGKRLLRTQNVSEQNQKHFLCPELKICVRNKCYARANGETTMCPRLPGP